MNEKTRVKPCNECFIFCGVAAHFCRHCGAPFSTYYKRKEKKENRALYVPKLSVNGDI